jgi:dolichol kinase
MTFDIIPFFVYNALFITATVLGEILHRKFKVEAFFTRKLTHTLTGLTCASFPFFIQSHWTVLAIASLFFALLAVSLARNGLKSINKTERKTYGSVIFPAVVYVNFLIYTKFGTVAQYVAVMSVFAVSDPLAALAGRYIKARNPHAKTFGPDRKTMFGSATFFVSACLLIFASFLFFAEIDFLKLLSLTIFGAFLATTAEAFSTKGFDNLTIPLVLFAFFLIF